MSQRNDLLLSNGPDEQRQIDRLTNTGGSQAGGSGPPTAAVAGTSNMLPPVTRSALGMGDPGRSLKSSSGSVGLTNDILERKPDGGAASGIAPFGISGNTDGPARFTFATSLRDMARFSEERETRKLQAAGLGIASVGKDREPDQYSPFDIWLKGTFTSFSDDRQKAGIDGHITALSIGADYVVSKSLLIGAVIQFDDMRQRSDTIETEVSGNGWMAGPYATARLTDNVFLQGRVAWGQSSNEISPFLTYVDKFDTTRWLASSTLSGRWSYGALQLSPSVSMAYIEDASNSYVDSLGVSIPSVKASIGQLKAGPEMSYKLELPKGILLEPHLGLQAIWNFAGSNVTDIDSGVPTGPPGVRGRVELGVQAFSTGGVGLDLSGSYDGVGSDDFQAITGRATLTVPLN